MKKNSARLCAVFRYAEKDSYLQQKHIETSEVYKIVKNTFGKIFIPFQNKFTLLFNLDNIEGSLTYWNSSCNFLSDFAIVKEKFWSRWQKNSSDHASLG